MLARSERRLPFSATVHLTMVLVLLLCCGPAALAFPRHDGAHREIETLEMQWRQALLNNDVDALDNMLADDYLGISANGTLETKADVLAVHRSGRVKLTQMNVSDVKIRIYGDTAVVTSRADIVGRNGDRDVSGTFRYTRVYNARVGSWKIVSFEASRVPPGRSGRP